MQQRLGRTGRGTGPQGSSVGRGALVPNDRHDPLGFVCPDPIPPIVARAFASAELVATMTRFIGGAKAAGVTERLVQLLVSAQSHGGLPVDAFAPLHVSPFAARPRVDIARFQRCFPHFCNVHGATLQDTWHAGAQAKEQPKEKEKKETHMAQETQAPKHVQTQVAQYETMPAFMKTGFGSRCGEAIGRLPRRGHYGAPLHSATPAHDPAKQATTSTVPTVPTVPGDEGARAAGEAHEEAVGGRAAQTE